MTNLQERIGALAALGYYLDNNAEELEQQYAFAERNNAWFTKDFCRMALNNIRELMLHEDALKSWADGYGAPLAQKQWSNQCLGLVLAGNLPLVGFHDIIVAYVSGISCKIKLSSKDQSLTQFLLMQLAEFDPHAPKLLQLVPRLTDFTAVIATGSNNTNRYFEQYFKDYPRILRQSRTSVAVIDGTESEEELRALGADIFSYFGFGCRNVSKLYVPESFDPTQLFALWAEYQWMHDHNKYMNNYDYNRTILLMNQSTHFSNDFIMIRPISDLAAPIATVHYDSYSQRSDVEQALQVHAEQLQCVVSKTPIEGFQHIAFGESQRPTLSDYADNIDTMQWLLNL